MFGLFKKTPPEGFEHIISADELLSQKRRQNLIKQIRDMIGTTPSVWDDFYFKQLKKVAEFVQLLPASEYHHHAYPGGLLDHLIEVAFLGASIRRGIENPLTERAEDMVTRRELLSYSVFTTCLNHDIGKVITRHKITVSDGEKESLLNPYIPISKQGIFVKTEFASNDYFDRHEPWATSLLPNMIGNAGLGWLYSDTKIYSWVLDTFCGKENTLSEIVRKADGNSVNKNMGKNDSGEVTGVQGRAQFLLPTYIREAIDKKLLVLNKPGAGAYFKEGILYCVETTLIDIIIKQFRHHKSTGLPSTHSRILDMLVEYGYAIHKGGVASALYLIKSDEWPNDTPLSVVRLNAETLYQDETRWPNNWNGSIVRQELLSQPDKTQESVNNDSAPNDDYHQESSTIVKSWAKGSPIEKDGDNNSGSTGNNEDETKTVVDSKQTNQENNSGNKPGSFSISLSTDDPAEAFIGWLTQSISNEDLHTNRRDSVIHGTGLGTALITPKIFRLYEEVTGIPFQQLQAQLGKTNLFKRNKKRGRIFKFEIQGNRKISHINAWLLDDEAQSIFEKYIDKKLNNNDHLKLINHQM